MYVGSLDATSKGQRLVEGQMGFYRSGGRQLNAPAEVASGHGAQAVTENDVIELGASPIGYFVLDAVVVANDEGAGAQ